MTPTTIRQGDRSPSLRITPELGCGERWDPDAFEDYEVTLAGPVTITGAMTVDATTGELVYAWAAGTTDVPGTYQVIVQAATVTTGLQRTFPPAGGQELVIAPMPG